MRKAVFSRDYKIFLEELRDARNEAGLTQVQLARRLRTSQSVVSKIERGERRLDIVELKNWCKALRVPLGEFIETLESRWQ